MKGTENEQDGKPDKILTMNLMTGGQRSHHRTVVLVAHRARMMKETEDEQGGKTDKIPMKIPMIVDPRSRHKVVESRC